MERKWRRKESFVVTFIDFKKAFDSLVWEVLWKVMECLGCPAKMVAVVRSLYSQSSISIRLSNEGELAPKFMQKKGTRQGSGLSPCIFTMPVDFAMRVADLACEELGMVIDEDKMHAYADDVGDRNPNEDEASASLQEFEAAAAAVARLGMSVPKTEAMGCRVKKAVASEEVENAMKEYVQVVIDGSKRRGWMAPAKWRAELEIESWEDEEVKGKMAIKLDDGEELLVEMRGGGWVMDCKNVCRRKLRMTRLGRLQSLSEKREKEKKKKRKVCEGCGAEFASEVSLLKHQEGGWCKSEDDMTTKELSRLRVTRRTAAAKRGETIVDVEPVEVRTCSGEVVKACGSFVYLGSLTTTRCSSSPEIRRRILKAGAACRNLREVWGTKGLSRKLKGRLYSTFVLSVMLYNCEVWTINKSDMKALEGKHVYLMRQVLKQVVRGGEERLSNIQLMEMLGLESIEEMIQKKRLQWVAHSARRGDEDLSWRRIRREVLDEHSKWGQHVRADWQSLGVSGVEEWRKKTEKRSWLANQLKRS